MHRIQVYYRRGGFDLFDFFDSLFCTGNTFPRVEAVVACVLHVSAVKIETMLLDI